MQRGSSLIHPTQELVRSNQGIQLNLSPHLQLDFLNFLIGCVALSNYFISGPWNSFLIIKQLDRLRGVTARIDRGHVDSLQHNTRHIVSAQ